MKNILIKGLFVCVSIVLVTSSVSALTISPARAELTADPGQAVSESFLVINEQDAEQIYYTSVENFESQRETGKPNFTASKEGLPSWVQVQDKITLKKGERAKIPYTISIPKNATPGGHFAAIFLSTNNPQSSTKQNSVESKVGMLLLLKVASSTPTSCVSLTRALSKGQENDEVLLLQQFLFDSGYLTVKPNGYFGNGTLSAVKKFQGANGLAQVGSIGPGTRGKVKEVSCGISSVVSNNINYDEQRKEDVTLIVNALKKFADDHDGKLPVYHLYADESASIMGSETGRAITILNKEICANLEKDCDSYADISYLVPKYLSKLPIEKGMRRKNGIGYMAKKTYNTVTVSAANEQSGKSIEASVVYDPNASSTKKTKDQIAQDSYTQQTKFEVDQENVKKYSKQQTSNILKMMSKVGYDCGVGASSSRCWPIVAFAETYVSTAYNKDDVRLGMVDQYKLTDNEINIAYKTMPYIQEYADLKRWIERDKMSDIDNAMIGVGMQSYYHYTLQFPMDIARPDGNFKPSSNPPKIKTILSGYKEIIITDTELASTVKGVYTMFLNNNKNMETNDITIKDALENCMTNHKSNPNSKIVCKWNEREIYHFTK